MKVGAVVTGAAGVKEFLPEEGGAKEDGWSESNMVAKLLFAEHPGIWDICNAQQKKMFAEKLEVKTRKQRRDSLQGVSNARNAD